MSDLNDLLSLCDIMPDDDENVKLFDHSKYYDLNTFEKLLADRSDVKRKLSIFNSNARSLVKHKSEYDSLFGSLFESNKFAFDILTFTETWMNDDLENIVQFDNYVSCFKHKSTNKEGGGIAVFVKNGIDFKLRHDISFSEDERYKYDCMFLEFTHTTGHSGNKEKNTILGILYRSPSYSSVHDLNESLSSLLHSIRNEDKNIV
jgi:hypothetical protein